MPTYLALETALQSTTSSLKHSCELDNGEPVRNDTGHRVITKRERHERFHFRQPRQVVKSATIKNNKADGTKEREKTVHLYVGKFGKFHFFGMYNLQQHTRLEHTKRLEVEVNRVPRRANAEAYNGNSR